MIFITAHIQQNPPIKRRTTELIRTSLISKHTKLSTKLLLYNNYCWNRYERTMVLMLPYYIQIPWSVTKTSNINRIQRFRSEVLRIISRDYVSSHHLDLKLSYATKITKLHYTNISINACWLIKWKSSYLQNSIP